MGSRNISGLRGSGIPVPISPPVGTKMRIDGGAMMLRLAVALLIAAGDEAPTLPAATDWPRWAGPHGDCTSDETGLLREWPKDGPKVLWRIPVAAGSNHPSVAGSELCYAQLEDNQKTESMKCVDANTGKEK